VAVLIAPGPLYVLGLALATAASMLAIWAEVLPRRVILRATMVERRRSVGNGGLRRPGFGETKNFWLVDGIERDDSTAVERSGRVAEEGRLKVWSVLACLRVMVIVSSNVASAIAFGSSSVLSGLLSYAKRT